MTAADATVSVPSTRHERIRPMRTVRDTWLIFRRSLILTIRQPVWILFGLMVPALYLFLFGPLLEGAVGAAGGAQNAFNWFVPGLIVQIAIFGTAFGGFGLIAEMRAGVVERMRVTPISRAGASAMKPRC